MLEFRKTNCIKPPCVLVLGGAGYIGSHCVLELLEQHDYRIVVVDNLSTGANGNISNSSGNITAVPEKVILEVADIRNKHELDCIFLRHAPIFAVFHLCAYIEVAESVKTPLEYYNNNVTGTLTVLEAMQQHKVKYIVFSSTASVYGTPIDSHPISEEHPLVPTSPYGETKRTIESALHWCEGAYGIQSVILRYFNACGADSSGNIGEDHKHETHLIPRLLKFAREKTGHFDIYGRDYPTTDGTCIRDYVHVSDLASAHIKALDYLKTHEKSECFNLGSGNGHSVLEVIDAVENVTGVKIPINFLPRRPGDPSSLVALCVKAEKMLGWKRKYSSLQDIVKTAWNFYLKHPNGYEKR